MPCLEINAVVFGDTNKSVPNLAEAEHDLRISGGLRSMLAVMFYVADQDNHRIRMVNTSGIISAIDGQSDLVWRSSGSGANAIWNRSSATQQITVSVSDANWQIVGIGDF